MYFIVLSAALVFLLDFIVLYSYEFCIIFSFLIATTITNKQRDLKIKSFQEVLAKLHENLCAKDCISACGGSFDKVDALTRLQKRSFNREQARPSSGLIDLVLPVPIVRYLVLVC
jgi:hypothetical protein